MWAPMAHVRLRLHPPGPEEAQATVRVRGREECKAFQRCVRESADAWLCCCPGDVDWPKSGSREFGAAANVDACRPSSNGAAGSAKAPRTVAQCRPSSHGVAGSAEATRTVAQSASPVELPTGAELRVARHQTQEGARPAKRKIHLAAGKTNP